MTIVEAKNVVKYLGGEKVVKNVTLEVEEGEKVALLGMSGAGKTTLFRMLNTSLRPDEGKVRLFGKDPSNQSRRGLRGIRERIGSVYQGGGLVPRLRAVDNVLIGEMGSWGKVGTVKSLVNPDYRRCLEALEEVGMGSKAFCRAKELSGGEVQRTAIARVMTQDADLVLADEPVSNLDPVNARNVLNILTRLPGDGVALVASLHQVENIRYFDRVLGLKDGELAFDTGPEEAGKLFERVYGGVK